MPGGKPYKPPSTQKQARWLGAVIGGAVKAPGLSKAEARGKLRGVDIGALPKKAKKKKSKG